MLTGSMRARTLILVLALGLWACGDGPPQGPAVETGFATASQPVVSRDDFCAMGHYLDTDHTVTDDMQAYLTRDQIAWEADLQYLHHSGPARSFAFGLRAPTPAIPLAVGVTHEVSLVLRGPAGDWLGVTSTQVQLHPDTLLVPVVVYNPGGAVANLDEAGARLLFDRAAETELPADLSFTSWARQRVDSVWAGCNVQFRLVDYREQWLAGECWQNPPVSNQDPFFQKCVTNRAACTAGDPAVQDFTDCGAQEVNRCTLRELLDWSAESPAYTGPVLYAPEAVNLYVVPAFHLWENMTAGIGCRGDVPFVALSDVFGDAGGLRLAHELGHVMGITEHTPGTVMGGDGERSATVTPELCGEARAYVMERYPWVR